MHRISRRSGTLIAAITMIALSWAAPVAYACPSCEAALGQSSEGAALATGYFWSILFMMSMPFLIFSAFCAVFYRMYRLSQRQVREAEGLERGPAMPEQTALAAPQPR